MNPLAQMMGGSPMMSNMQAMMGQINNLKQMFSGDGSAAIKMLSQKNPQFAQFVKENQGKSAEQIAQDYGIDLNMIKSFMG